MMSSHNLWWEIGEWLNNHRLSLTRDEVNAIADAQVAIARIDDTEPDPVAEAMALCEDCPPQDYPTDKTRCSSCPRRKPAAAQE